MIIHELSPADCADVCPGPTWPAARLLPHEPAYVVPVSFAYDPRQVCLLLFSAVGRKVEWMRENPNVCLEIEDLEDRFHWTTVVVFGRYDELGDGPEDSEIRLRALHLFNDRSRWWLPGAAKPGGVDHQGVVISHPHRPHDRQATARAEHSPSRNGRRLGSR